MQGCMQVASISSMAYHNYQTLITTLLTDSCTATEAESAVDICITISLCQRFLLLMNSKSNQEQNLSTYRSSVNTQLRNCVKLLTHFTQKCNLT